MNYNYQRYIESFSTPDDLKFGFEIVFRIQFKTESVNLPRLQCLLKDTFQTDENHLETPYNGPVGSSEYWRVFWDNGKHLPLDLVEAIEKNLNEYAKTTGEIEVLEMVIQPRKLETVKKNYGKRTPS